MNLWSLSFIVVSFLFGHYGLAKAIDCPKPPEQMTKDWEVQVKGEVVKIGPLKGGELQTKTKSATSDLLSRLPDADRVYLEQMMFSAYCSALRDDRSLKESERAERIKIYNQEVRKTIQAYRKERKLPSKGTAVTPYLRPLVIQDTFATSVPFTDGGGDKSIPPFDPLQLGYGVRDPAFVVTTKFSELAKLVPAKPGTVDDIFGYLCELLQYYIFEYIYFAESELYGISWTAGEAQKSTVTPALTPPDNSLFSQDNLVKLLSANRFGKARLSFWNDKQLKVPQGTTIIFTDAPQWTLQLSHSKLYKLMFSIRRGGLFLDNYGFLPPGFKVSPEDHVRTRSFPLVVEWRFEFYRTKDADPLQQEQYVNWAQSLFQRVRKGIEN